MFHHYFLLVLFCVSQIFAVHIDALTWYVILENYYDREHGEKQNVFSLLFFFFLATGPRARKPPLAASISVLHSPSPMAVGRIKAVKNQTALWA